MNSAPWARKVLLLLPVFGALCVSAHAQQPAKNPSTVATKSAPAKTQPTAAGAQKLPLRRVVLYKSGVGYFEHDGNVRGNEDVEIDLTSSQLDDVLKSLTALDLSGGRIVGASYNSQDSAGHQLEALPVSLNDKNTLSELLQELRGARLEVRTSAGAFTGRLLSVEEKSSTQNGTEVKRDQVSLLGDGGEVRSFTLDPSTSLRFADRDLEQQLARALGLLDSTHQEDTRHLVLSTTGTGERQLRVSYISEVPVWKTTYRIVLPSQTNSSGAKPLLQGWAVVDNTVGEDWNDVELSLAAGAPQSFIQHISQPYYTQRPEVPMPRGLLLSPQMHGGTLSQMAAAPARIPGGVAGGMIGGMPGGGGGPGGGRGGAGGFGAGIATGSGGGVGYGSGSDTGGRSFIADDTEFKVDESAFLAAARNINSAQGNSLGDLFQYTLRDHVTIRKNESALVPIIQTDITAEKVSLWNAGLGMPRPLRALWLTNSSTLVLDGGSFSMVEGETFAGEGLFDSIQPGEKRLISYAADLAMQVVAKQEGTPEKTTRVRVARGILIRTVESRQKVNYTVRNEDVATRTLVIEHPVRTGWKLVPDLKPDEESATAYRFKVEVPSKETKTFTVEETRPVSSQFTLNNLNQNQLEMFLTQRSITPEVEQALRQILAKKDVVAKFDSVINAKQAGVDRIVSDQNRLRENMKALKGTPEEKALTERYTGELNDQETQLAALRKDIAALEAQRQKAQEDLDSTIEHMAFDVTM
jgi:hypothetical protein